MMDAVALHVIRRELGMALTAVRSVSRSDFVNFFEMPIPFARLSEVRFDVVARRATGVVASFIRSYYP